MMKLISFALILLSIAQTCEAASHRIAFQVSPSRRQRTQCYRGNDRTTTRRWAEPADESHGINTDVAEPATTPLTPALPTTEPSAVLTTSTTAATTAGESYVRCGRCQTYYTLVLEDYGLHKASSKGWYVQCSEMHVSRRIWCCKMHTIVGQSMSYIPPVMPHITNLHSQSFGMQRLPTLLVSV